LKKKAKVGLLGGVFILLGDSSNCLHEAVAMNLNFLSLNKSKKSSFLKKGFHIPELLALETRVNPVAFTANVLYNNSTIEIALTSTGINASANTLTITNSDLTTIVLDAGAGNTIKLTNQSNGALIIPSSGSDVQIATIGTQSNAILGLKMVGNVGQDRYTFGDFNSASNPLTTAASFGVTIDAASISGANNQDTLTINGGIRVTGTGSFTTSNSTPTQNLDQITINAAGQINAEYGNILLVANRGGTSNININGIASNALYNLETLSTNTTSSGSINLIAGQAINIRGNAFKTNGGAINLNSATILTGATNISTGINKADVTFASTLDGTFDLDVNSTGSLNFQGNIGATTTLGNITTQSLTGLNVGTVLNDATNTKANVVSVNAASFNTGGGVNGNILFSGTQNYTTITGLDLIATKRSATLVDVGAAGDITLNGAITMDSKTTPNAALNAALNLAHDGALNINANITNGLFTEVPGTTSSVTPIVNIGGNADVTITSDAGISFISPVNLNSNLTLKTGGSQGVTFNETLNGPLGLTVNSTGPLLFKGAVGATSTVGAISTTTNNPASLTFINTLKVGSITATVQGDVIMTNDQVYLGSGLNLVTLSSASNIRLGKINGTGSSSAGVSISNAGNLFINDDIVVGGSFTQGPLLTGIILVNGGTGYTTYPSVTVANGGGSGAIAQSFLAVGSAIVPTLAATATANLSPFTLNSINIISGGAGYTSAPTVVISAPSSGGTQATATATINGAGVVTAINITNGGSGYTTAPTITLSGGGSGPIQPNVVGVTIVATANSTLVANVPSLNLTNKGSGYTVAPIVTIDPPTLLGGIQATAVATISNGIVTALTITNPGSGYSVTPNVSLFPNLGGAGYTDQPGINGNDNIVSLIPLTGTVGPDGTYLATATVTSVTATGAITGLTLLDGGKYSIGSSPNGLTGLRVISAKDIGTGATLNATGFVNAVNLTSLGSSYTSAPTISFTGGSGIGASAIANFLTGTGQVIIGNLGKSETITIDAGFSGDITFTSSMTLNQNLSLDTSSQIISDITLGPVEGGSLSLLPSITMVAGGNLSFNGTIGVTNPLGAIDASSNIVTSASSGSACLGINAASLSISASNSINLSAPQIYTGSTLANGAVFGLNLSNINNSSAITLGTVTTREYFSGAVGSVIVNSGGSNYLTAPTVSIIPNGGGAGATATSSLGITLGNNSDGTLAVQLPGLGYAKDQIVQIVQLDMGNIIGSAIAQITSVDSNGGILTISMLSSGGGFTDLTNNLQVIVSGYGGTGSGGIISAKGLVNAVVITNGGTGYTLIPTINFTSTSGIGANATAVLAQESSSVTINNGGALNLIGNINTRGNFTQSGTGVVNIGNTAVIPIPDISLNSAGGDVFFNTFVNVQANFTVNSSINGAASGAITFNNTVNSKSNNNLTVIAGVSGQGLQSGDVLLKGTLGINPMGNIQVNNPNNFGIIGNVIAKSLVVNGANGSVTFSGNLNSAGSVTLQTINTSGLVVLQNSITSGGNVVIQNSGSLITTNNADFVITGIFTQTGSGSSFISGDITTTLGGISFRGPVSFSGKPLFNARNNTSTNPVIKADIIFENDVNGLGGISLAATGRVLFLGNVGLINPLSTIEIVNAGFTNSLDLIAVQFNSSSGQRINSSNILITNANGRVVFNGVTNISNTITTTSNIYDIVFNGNTTVGSNANFINGGKVTLASTTNFNGSAYFSNAGSVDASGTIIVSGSLNVQRPLNISNSLELFLNSPSNTFGSTVTGGNSQVTLNNGGTLVLSGNSPSFTGNFVLNSSLVNTVLVPSVLQVSADYSKASVILNGGTLTGAGRVLNVQSSTIASGIAVLGTGLNVGKVMSISVTNSGFGYASAPTVTIAAPSSGGTRATATALLGTGASAGQIVGFTITNSGSGYTSIPSVTISLPTIGGTINPGVPLGRLTVGNQLNFASTNTYLTTINGSSQGTYGQTNIISGGFVNINSANLAFILNANLQVGNQLTLLNIGTGSGSLGNFTFNGAPLLQGGTFSLTANGSTTSFSINYRGGDGNDIVLTVTAVSPYTAPPGTLLPTQAVGVDYGGGSVVQINYNNGTNLSFFAYSSAYTGGVRVALGDINGDGIDELITGTGIGGGPHIKVFNLQGGQPVEIASFFAFEPTFMGGVYISTGDINNDGLADIIVGAGSSGGPRVKVFSGNSSYFINAVAPLMDFFAYDLNFTGGVTVAAGNRDLNPGDEVITGAGVGGGPNVRSFNAAGQMIDNFFAFATNITTGIFVAAGYVDSDATADIIAGTGFGTPSQVAAFFSTGARPTAMPFVPGFIGGARVGVALNSLGQEVFAVAAGPGGGPQVNIFNNSLATIDSFFAINPLFNGGLYLNTTL